MNDDIALLKRLGEILGCKTVRDVTSDTPTKRTRAGVPAPHQTESPRAGASAPHETIRDFLIRSLLKVRSKARGLVPLIPNQAQREFAANCAHRNIVLKARQMGITTYVAARFFVQTITRPGTMTVQVAHDQESAEEIFKIVHRFWENLPETMKRGALTRSRANVRQMVFPRLDCEYRVATAADVNAGRGLTIHNLHCSEVARWLRDPQEALASLRAAVPVDGDIILNDKFKEGLSKMIDGAVECLNASVWAKQESAAK